MWDTGRHFFFLGKSTIFFSRKINGKKINIFFSGKSTGKFSGKTAEKILTGKNQHFFLAENQRENSAETQRKKFHFKWNFKWKEQSKIALIPSKKGLGLWESINS